MDGRMRQWSIRHCPKLTGLTGTAGTVVISMDSTPRNFKLYKLNGIKCHLVINKS